MKLFIGFLFATLALNGVFSLPARNPSDDAEVIGGPRRVSTRNDDAADDDDDDFTHFRGVIDTGSGYPFLQPNPSVIRVGFFDSFDDLFRRFSARVFPTSLFGGRTDSDDSDEDSNDHGIGSLFPKIPTDKGNTTSTVKIVDGHKVEVNETTYGDANSVFKVRVVNIRPVEDGETVDETVITNKNNNDDSDNLKPVTSAPVNKNDNAETDDDSDERREPLEKKPDDNEIQGNIDDPEHSIAKNENIVETTTTTATTSTIETTETAAIDNNTMLPTNEDINGAFVTDNSLEQEQEDAAAVAAEELNANENNNNGNGSNEFETNMSEDDNTSTNSNSNNNNDNDDDNVDNVENAEVEHTIENNEDTEEEVNDNLNESSTTKEDAQQDENNRESEGDEDEDVEDDVADDVDDDVENVNSNEKRASAALRHKERENEFSSDDEDASNPTAIEMHPTFNDEWGSLNNEQNNENNDFNNDIDVYDVEPIDLSNDIAVNDAADLPINPDAEFIDIYGVQHPPNTMPKFEKLSLNYPNEPATAEELDWSHTAPSK